MGGKRDAIGLSGDQCIFRVTAVGGPAKEYTNSIGMKFVLIPAGSFQMGAPESEKDSQSDERPVHTVWISKAFYMGIYEVTQAQWEKVMGSNPSNFKGPNLPVELVSWNDCQEFIRRLNTREGANLYRLPTEAEWEYGCRAGSTGAYAGDLNAMGWYGDNSGRTRLDAADIWRTDQSNYGQRIVDNGNQTHPVGQKAPNAWGLYDMHGNVGEWCSDWYDSDYYKKSPAVDPGGASSGSYRILRGGGWRNLASHCRSADRFIISLLYRRIYLGFRLMRMALP